MSMLKKKLFKLTLSCSNNTNNKHTKTSSEFSGNVKGRLLTFTFSYTEDKYNKLNKDKIIQTSVDEDKRDENNPKANAASGNIQIDSAFGRRSSQGGQGDMRHFPNITHFFPPIS